ASIAYKKGAKVILNPAPAPAGSLSPELLKCLYAIIPNETEAELISGVPVCDGESARKAAACISSKGVDIVIITMGSKGAFIKEGNSCYRVPVEKVKAVDTTAAGDTFCGAFCVALSEDYSIMEAVRIANKASGIAVMREGAQNSIPYKKEMLFNQI
ncbi:MAG: PfkB family carbohydrate kinase, partial [Bacteroidota bacterium]|nr:PfkB family carbohydrate kinase [Bacteroidota bacterium]